MEGVRSAGGGGGGGGKAQGGYTAQDGQVLSVQAKARLAQSLMELNTEHGAAKDGHRQWRELALNSAHSGARTDAQQVRVGMLWGWLG